jgi:hypothetical protein
VLALVTALLTIPAFLMPDRIAAALGAPALAPYLWLVPLCVAMAGSYSALQFWATRARRFGAIARTRVGQAAAGGLAMLALCYQQRRVNALRRSISKRAHLTIMPNPATEMAWVNVPEGSWKGSWELIDAMGRVVKNINPSTSNQAQLFSIDLSDLSNGVYILRIQDSEGRSAIGRLVKN